MKPKPILFAAPMVKALLEGRKTQTRRLLKAAVPERPAFSNVRGRAKHDWPYLDAYCDQPKTAANPRGMGPLWCWWTRDDRPGATFKVGYVPGDMLWVRESAVIAPQRWTDSPVNPCGPHRQEVGYLADDPRGQVSEAARDYGLKGTPAIHMPRWASRLTLEVTEVRVDRLRHITEADARAEGFEPSAGGDAWHAFLDAWNVLYGDGATDANPYIVALTFIVHRCNVDALLAQRAAA
jgi:hypothetical protein